MAIELEMMACYNGWISYICPDCGSTEVGMCANSTCYSCGHSGINYDGLWYTQEERLNYHLTGKTK